METIYERAAGLDVHKDTVVACVRTLTGREGKTAKTRKGRKWLQTHLNEAAKAATRSTGTYLSAQYARLKPRRGHAKATVAVEHSILVAAWFLRRNDPARHAQRLARQIRALGYDVTLATTTPAT